MHSQLLNNKLVANDQPAQANSALLPPPFLLKPTLPLPFPQQLQSLGIGLSGFSTQNLMNPGISLLCSQQQFIQTLLARSHLNLTVDPKTPEWPSLLWAIFASNANSILGHGHGEQLPAEDNCRRKHLGLLGPSLTSGSAPGKGRSVMKMQSNLAQDRIIATENRLEGVPKTSPRTMHSRSSSGSGPANGIAFSIADLLASTTTHLAVPSNLGSAQSRKYYFEELPWTDGRRVRYRRERHDQVVQGGIAKRTKKVKDDEGSHFIPPLPTEAVGKRLEGNQRLGIAGHTCQQCGKSYATSSNLSRHKQTHRPLDSPFAKKCTFCDRVYVSMPALSMHLLTHQASHKCHICGKLFSRPWLLKGHLRSHTGQKPFGCGKCGKAFSDRSNLRAHLNTHNHEKRFECTRCGRLFALKSYLNKHLVDGKCQQSPSVETGNSCRSCSALPELEEPIDVAQHEQQQ